MALRLRRSAIVSSFLSLFIALAACGSDDGPTVETPGLAVNAYLWTASFDTLNFLPVRYTDPVGGVQAFDWYADPRKENERFRADVYILDTRLRADAVRVSVFKQRLVNGEWRDADVEPGTAAQIENAILTRARQLKLAQDEG